MIEKMIVFFTENLWIIPAGLFIAVGAILATVRFVRKQRCANAPTTPSGGGATPPPPPAKPWWEGHECRLIGLGLVVFGLFVFAQAVPSGWTWLTNNPGWFAVVIGFCVMWIVAKCPGMGKAITLVALIAIGGLIGAYMEEHEKDAPPEISRAKESSRNTEVAKELPRTEKKVTVEYKGENVFTEVETPKGYKISSAACPDNAWVAFSGPKIPGGKARADCANPKIHGDLDDAQIAFAPKRAGDTATVIVRYVSR